MTASRTASAAIPRGQPHHGRGGDRRVPARDDRVHDPTGEHRGDHTDAGRDDGEQQEGQAAAVGAAKRQMRGTVPLLIERGASTPWVTLRSIPNGLSTRSPSDGGATRACPAELPR